MIWDIVFLDETVRDELEAFPVDIRARFERIQAHGLERVREVS